MPAEPERDILYSNWSKPDYDPIANGTNKDPSAAWYVPFGGSDSGEWRFRDNAGVVYSSADFKKWTRVGTVESFAKGDCPSLFPLPTNGESGTSTSVSHSPDATMQPSHVMKVSQLGHDFMQVGRYVAGNRGSAGGWIANAR